MGVTGSAKVQGWAPPSRSSRRECILINPRETHGQGKICSRRESTQRWSCFASVLIIGLLLWIINRITATIY